jgi:hypothetical protein
MQSFTTQSINPLQLMVAVQDRIVSSDGVATIALPPNTFQHTDPAENVKVEALLSDGSPLPSFITFDAENLEFQVNAEAARELGVKAVDVKIIGRDSQGNEAAGLFRIVILQEDLDEEEIPVPDGDPNLEIEEGGEQEGAEETTEDQVFHEGSTPLAEQVKMAGRFGFFQDRDLLLNDLMRIASR